MRGHIHKRVRTNAAGKETTRWYVVVDVGRDAEGERRQKWHGGFPTRREAEIERARIVNDLHTGGYVAPDRLTLTDWVRESWMPMTRTRVKPSTTGPANLAAAATGTVRNQIARLGPNSHAARSRSREPSARSAGHRTSESDSTAVASESADVRAPSRTRRRGFTGGPPGVILHVRRPR